MTAPAMKLVLNGAPSQFERRLQALRRDWARVDGRSFAELLDFAVRYAALINFYDLRNEIDGDFVPFFVGDATMALATLAAFDAPAAERAFEQALRRARAAQGDEARLRQVRETAALALGHARLLNACLDGLREARGAAAALLRHEIEAEIEDGLGARLRELRAWDEGAAHPQALGRALGLDYSGFQPAWRVEAARGDAAAWRGRTLAQRADRGLRRLRANAEAFVASLQGLRGLAKRNLAATLRRNDHAPQLGLYMAFARLFRHAQLTLNTFSRRYARFYYRDVLRGAPAGALPDSTWLTFALAEEEGVLAADVPQGTLFPAGQDAEGREIVYASDEALRVTDARLQRLLMLRQRHGALYEPLTGVAVALAGGAPTVVREILASEVALDAPAPDGAPAGWLTFGADVSGTSGAQTTQPATLGFAVASNYLELHGGTRDVTLTLTLAEGQRRDLLNARLAELSAVTGLAPDAVFRAVAEQALRLSLSSADGFFDVQSYDSPPPASEEVEVTQLLLHFRLTSGAPAVTPLGTEAEAEDPETIDLLSPPPPDPAPSLPTLEAYLRQEPVPVSGPTGSVLVAPLSLFGEVVIAELTLRVDVAGLADVTVETSDGEADTSSPFAVFGSQPVVGSYLRLRHAELFVKRLGRLDLGLRWFNLPTQPTGFEGYYRDYVLDTAGEPLVPRYDNAVFGGAWSVLSPGLWDLASPTTGAAGPIDVELFRTLAPTLPPSCAPGPPQPDGPLCPRSDFGPFTPLAARPPDYYDPAQSALQLELRTPQNGFGNDLYSINVLHAVLEDLPDQDACEEACQSQWAIYDETARGLSNALLRCADVPDDQFAACIKPQVELLVAALLVAAVERFAACAGRCGEQQALASARLEALLSQPPFEGARSLRHALADPTVDSCLARCVAEALPLVDAALRVVAAMVGCEAVPADYKACVMAALAECQTWFEIAYKDGLQACLETCLKPGTDMRYPNEPWLPQAETLDVGYGASCRSGDVGAHDELRFFHLTPFGGWQAQPLTGARHATLLPLVEQDGSALLGFAGTLPAQPLTLFVETGAPLPGASSDELPGVTWAYLSGERWLALDAQQVPKDTTHGLQNTGVVKLALPAFEAAAHTSLPASWQWLAAAVPRDAAAFPRTFTLLPHATLVTWVDNGVGGAHLAQPLPAHTITASVQDLPDVASIDQPVASFGGRPAENNRTFETRLGERLRHKQRAVLAWDYERLVLERFPSVWKVQALPAHDVTRAHVPAHVLVMVVPGADGVTAQDPTVPAAPAELLASIRAYLQARTSPFVRLDVVNPVYVRLRVRATLSVSGEAGASLDRLEAELVRYLSPWFYDAARAARGGAYASEDDVSEFIQTRPYVTSLESIAFDYTPSPESLPGDWYFLTSAESHELRESAGVSPCADEQG